MKTPRRMVSLCSVLVTLGLASVAAAQSQVTDKASAEALFNEGVALVERGSYAEGCSKFEGSQELEPTLGTELHLADCYERMGRTASAWALFKEGQGLARKQGDSEREEVARERVERLVPKLSYLTIELDGPVPPSLRVVRNGRDVPLASLGVAIPVDPGVQDVTASAPSYRAWKSRVDVPAGPGRVYLLVPRLRALPSATPVKPAASAPPPASSPQRTWGIAVGSVGLAGVLAGAGLGIWAKHQYDRSREDRYCPTDDHNGCTSEGLALRHDAEHLATASTITLAAGGVLLATGVVLWSTAPRREDQPQAQRARFTASVGPDCFRTAVEAVW